MNQINMFFDAKKLWKNLFYNIDQNERSVGKPMYLKTTEMYVDDLMCEF